MAATEIKPLANGQIDGGDPPPYSLTIEWDDRDSIFVVSSAEWPGNHTHGHSYEEALAAGRDMLAGLVEVTRNRSQALPPVREFKRANPRYTA